jgi:hypothetical protein
MKLIWHQRPDGLWNAPCACGASTVGVAFEQREIAETEHFYTSNIERMQRAGTPRQIHPCGPKLPEATQHIPTLVFP